jgi:TorA maturation chaperone TorD
LREFLARIGVARSTGQTEPEDHAAILCEIMARFVSRDLSASASVEGELFEKHMAPWMGRFFSDLEHAKHADFYRHVGALGRVFLEIEIEALGLPT